MEVDNKYKSIPFWSWNGELDMKKLTDQIQWMHDVGIGGFFMHARGGLTTPYLGEKWFKCVQACEKKAKELGMNAYAYDENGWPSGFAGGKLLVDENDRDCYLTYNHGPYDEKALASYDDSNDNLVRVYQGENVLNVYKHISSSTTDICNKEVVKKFISLTHEEYKKHDIYGNLQGFFTDEPQYYRWRTAYTNVLSDCFKKKYGQDLLDHLGLIFVEKNGYRELRYRYWLCMNELMVESFGKQIYQWCDKNNYKLTGHYVEEASLAGQMMCNAGIMPLYEYEHIPGIDWLGRRSGGNDLSAKQLSSVAAQLGKKQTLVEIFACAGWDTTPLEYKHLADWMFVNGVNLICQHLLPYDEHAETKRDYPAHFTPLNPWIKKSFKEFNDHYNELSYLLCNSKEEVQVGLFQPIRSCYFGFKRDEMHLGTGTKELDESLWKALNKLSYSHIPYHMIDETLLEKHGRVEGDKLIIGNVYYTHVVFPLAYTMGSYTKKLLDEFASNGGKILFLESKPTYLEGQPCDYEELESNFEFEDLFKVVPFDAPYHNQIKLTYRIDDKGRRFFFIVNMGEKTSFRLNGHNLNFDTYESKLIYEDELKDEVNGNEKEMVLPLKWRLCEKVDNYLLLDNVSFSKDGENYSKDLNYMGAFMELVKDKYEGDIYLKYCFNVEKIPAKCGLISEYEQVDFIIVNGTKASLGGDSHLNEEYKRYECSSLIKKGKNEVIVKLNFVKTPYLYECLFTGGVLENIKNSLAYNSTIEPLFLIGEFGVKGEFVNKDGRCLGKDFVIGDQSLEITSLVEGGFPFYRGDIALEGEVNYDGSNGIIRFDNRFHVIDVYVNDVFGKRLLLEKQFDAKEMLRLGKNKIKIVLTVGNRNLFGPNHIAEEDGVGPYSWERPGSWVDGISNAYFHEYSFVKTII